MIFLAIWLWGCSPGTTVRRGSLSEAAKKSKNSYTEERKLRKTKVKREKHHGDNDKFCFLSFIFNNDDDRCCEHDHSHVHTDPRPPSPPRSYDRGESKTTRWFGPIAFARNAGVYGLSPEAGGGVRLSFSSYERAIHSFELGVAHDPVLKGSELFGATSSIVTGSLGYQLRMLVSHNTSGPFVSLGADMRYRGWEYRNALTSDVVDAYDERLYTDTITGDGIGVFAPSVGGGFIASVGDWLRPSLECRIGGVLYQNRTSEHFTNDLFRNALFAKVILGVEVVW